MPYRRRQTRRSFLKHGAAAGSLAVLAGCTGDGGSNTDTPGGGGGTTVGGGEPTPDLTDPDSWRQYASEKAAEELQGDQELLFYTSTRNEEYRTKLAEMEFSGVYEPLNGKLSQSSATSSKLETRYQRELKTGSTTTVDLIDATPEDMLSQGVPFLDLSNVPSFRNAPDSVVWRPYLGAQSIFGQGLAYNTDRVDEPPETYDDLLDERFADGEISADMTPTAKVVAAFYTQQGEDFVHKLREQKPKFINSKFSMTKACATGEVKVALFAMLPHIQSQKNDGLPLEYVPNPDIWYWRPKTIEVSAKAPHPWAAKLWIDWLMDPEQADLQSTRPGAHAINGEKANPQELAELFNPDEQEVWVGNEFDRPIAEIEQDYLEAIGAPV